MGKRSRSGTADNQDYAMTTQSQVYASTANKLHGDHKPPSSSVDTLQADERPAPHLGLFSGIGMIVGLIIGSGIFATAGETARSPGMNLLSWALAGILSAFGGLCYVELGCAMPSSGGEHVYLLKAYGPYVAYVFDWTTALLALPSQTAAMAIVGAEYLVQVIFIERDVDPDVMQEKAARYHYLVKPISMSFLIILAILNILSSRLGARISNVFTLLKIGALTMIIIIGIVYLCRGHVDNFKDAFKNSSTKPYDYGKAIYLQLFSYCGWNNLNYMVSELKNPTRNLPLAIMFSMSIVISIYLMTLISYFAVLDLKSIQSTVSGTWFGYVSMGFAGAIIIPIMVTCSTIGAANANLIGNSRLIAASSDEGILFPKLFANLNRKTTTPLNAIILTCLVSCLYCIPQDTTLLFNISSFTQCIFTLLTVGGLIMMRYTHPHMHRPFRVFTPLAYLFCIVTLGLIVFPFLDLSSFNDALPFVISIIIMVVPLPIIYWGLQRSRASQSS